MKIDYLSVLPTGFEPLDNIMGGFHYGNLVTLAGRPCMRTEYFTYSLLRNWLNDETINEDVVFFSLRTRKELVTHRIGLQVADGQESMKWTAEYHLRGLEISILCNKIRSYAWNEQKKVFVIDNFNFIEVSSGDYGLRNHRQVIAKELCKLAHELDVIIIVDAMLFSYYIGDGEGMEGKHPSLADLGYQGMSGDLDVFSDMVLSFWAPEKYHIYQNELGEDLHGILEIEILKNVNNDYSEGRRISLYMNGETLCIENPIKRKYLNSFNPKSKEPF